jgi:hypothetical protein
MAEMRDEDYTHFNPGLECDGLDAHQLGNDLEWVLTDLQVEGAIVSIQCVGPRAIWVQFVNPSGGILARAEVSSVERATWWLCDQGVRHYPAFARQHALWMGAEYCPAAPKMRDYGCTCPNTPDVEETGTYVVYEKCPFTAPGNLARASPARRCLHDHYFAQYLREAVL